MQIKKAFYLALIFLGIFQALPQAQTNAPASTDPATVMLPPADFHFSEWRQQDFLKFDPHYAEELTNRIARAKLLGKQVIGREMAGQNTELSHQILIEILWLISATADFKQLDQRLDDLQASLDHPEREAQAEEENPADGSWGAGCTQWFCTLRASYDHLEDAKYELHFIDRINSPKKLTNYFNSISVSDIARTGIDNGNEFNESLSDLMRMILRHDPKQYAYDPKLKATMTDLIMNQLRDPATGYWGERYVHNGQTQFVDDVSDTFHVVSYLSGDVPDMDKIIATTLAAQDLEFPAGNLYKGKRYDHLNVDVAELFRLGWPHASDAQKKGIAAELHKLLQFCLTESLQPDGSFKMWVGDFSKEESTYYGASFLARIGYFDKSKRFWTDEDFPDAENVRQKIIAYILNHQKTGATGGVYYKSALKHLEYEPSP
jgi:hypothetical protein